VTRRIALPTAKDVERAIKDLTASTGKPPTVLAIAVHLGLANTTFRRHFPDIVADVVTGLRQSRTGTSLTANDSAISRFDQLKLDNNKLRRNNHDLAEHLDLAIANIQRLTLENHHLRQQLEAAAKVSRIGPTQRPHRY
jgi:hypothetical protein